MVVYGGFYGRFCGRDSGFYNMQKFADFLSSPYVFLYQ